MPFSHAGVMALLTAIKVSQQVNYSLWLDRNTSTPNGWIATAHIQTFMLPRGWVLPWLFPFEPTWGWYVRVTCFNKKSVSCLLECFKWPSSTFIRQRQIEARGLWIQAKSGVRWRCFSCRWFTLADEWWYCTVKFISQFCTTRFMFGANI